MTTVITQKIVGQFVVKKGDKPAEPPAVTTLDERLARPDVLSGATYKVKTPLSDHALYITINDIILNPGEATETRRPFEIFINSKAMDHFQWIVALTRIVSAVFRKGGDVIFLIEEMRSIFDPKGGYFKKGGKYMPSLVAEIGEVLLLHLTGLGMMQRDNSLVESAKKMVAEKIEKVGAPDGKQQCARCGERSVVVLDGCATCLACGDSKCG